MNNSSETILPLWSLPKLGYNPNPPNYLIADFFSGTVILLHCELYSAYVTSLFTLPVVPEFGLIAFIYVII